MGGLHPGNKSWSNDLTQHEIAIRHNPRERATWRLAMIGRLDDNEPIDHRTSRSICDAIGERLQQYMKPEPFLSDRLQQLLNEMRRRDHDRP